MENFQTYKIVTNRLIIRPYGPQDVQAFSDALNQNVEHLSTFLPWARTDSHDIETVAQKFRKFRSWYDSGQDYIMGIFDRESNALLGGTGWHLRVGDHAAEIGYWVLNTETKRGIATEAAAALTKVGFEVEGLERMQIHTQIDNKISQKIPKRLGYIKEAVLRKRISSIEGEAKDIVINSLLRTEYLGSEIAKMDLQAYDFMDRPLMLNSSID